MDYEEGTMRYFLHVRRKSHYDNSYGEYQRDTNHFLAADYLEEALKYVESTYKDLSDIENIEVLEVVNVHQYKHIITRNERIRKQEELTAAKKAAELEVKEKAELARLQEKYGKV